MNDDGPRYANLRDYLRLLRRQWLLILIPTVVATGAALFFATRTKPTYQATASVSIQDETQNLALLGTSVAPGSAPGASPVIVAQTADTPALANAVKRTLRTPLPAQTLRASISLSVNGDTGFLDVTAVAGKAAFAAGLANAYATQIAASTTRTERNEFAAARRILEKRLRSLNPSNPADQAEVSTLQDEISRLEFLQTNGSAGQVAQFAQVPSVPASPKPLRDAGLGALAGLLFGLILAFLRQSLDRRLRGSAEIHAELGYQLLGQVRAQTMGRVMQPSSATNKKVAGDVEAFRIIRRNVDSLTGEQGPRVILVTSGLPREGKSTVAASLALATAVTGRRTLLIDGDLRRPSLSQRLGISAAPGLTDYLIGEVEPQGVLQAVPVRTPDLSSNGTRPDPSSDSTAPMVVCISAGAQSGRSAELLASSRMRTLIEEVTQVYDRVIFDSAPLLPVADTLELLSLVDAVILCVRSGHTTRDQARAAQRALGQVPPQCIGVVVTDLQARDEPAGSGMYPYSYSSAERVTG